MQWYIQSMKSTLAPNNTSKVYLLCTPQVDEETQGICTRPYSSPAGDTLAQRMQLWLVPFFRNKLEHGIKSEKNLGD